MLVKADLHIHSSLDPVDIINLKPEFLIDKAKEFGFKVMAFTHHEQYFCSKEIEEYAKKKGLLIIPGGERSIEGRDVLIYNVPQEKFDKVKNFKDLESLKKKHPESLIIAPHPCVPFRSLNGKLEKYHYLFDAVEWMHFYTRFLNYNKKAARIAKKHKLPLIASSDTHFKCQFGRNYSEIETDSLSRKAVIKAIKQGNIKLQTKPLSIFEFIKVVLRIFWMDLQILKRNLNAQNPPPHKCKK